MDVTGDLKNNEVAILIVEDSPTQAEQLRHLLEERRYKVRVATNGAQALSLLVEHKPTLIVSDVMMPEMDGYALCREIKTNESLRDIPVILVTQLSSPQDVIKGLECGADNFIIKPYNEKYLLSRIQYILTNQELRKKEKTRMGVEIFFAGQKYFITSERQQILDLLLSTYDTAVQKNFELIKAQNELRELNEQLEERIEEKTADLRKEIEERKRTEEVLRRVNRALKTLSECNQVLIRAADEPALLHEICKVIVEVGGHRMAWVGFAGHDEKQTVQPVGKAGYDDGYLEKAKITWADTERGQCPVGTVIRTGASDITRDVRSDPRFEPWRDEALKRGYYSVIACPLVIGKENIGALAIYAGEPDAFDDEEVKLLEEMASDVSFGIKSLRMSEERKRAEDELRQRVEELERFRKATIQREFRIKDFKDRVKELEEQVASLKSEGKK